MCDMFFSPVLVTSSNQFIHIEKHCSSIAAFQRGQALAMRIRLVSQFVNFCVKLARRHLRPERTPSSSTSGIQLFGIVAAHSIGRVVGKGLFGAFSDRCDTHRISHSSRGSVAHRCSVTNSGIASATRFLLTPCHCAFASRGCDDRASHGLTSKLGTSELTVAVDQDPPECCRAQGGSHSRAPARRLCPPRREGMHPLNLAH